MDVFKAYNTWRSHLLSETEKNETWEKPLTGTVNMKVLLVKIYNLERHNLVQRMRRHRLYQKEPNFIRQFR